MPIKNKKRMNSIAAVAAIALAMVTAAVMWAGEPSQPVPQPSRVSLLAETTAVVPGSRLWLGLYFRMDPGWHIYWVNSGDSGQPPSVKWELPGGFHADRMVWPVPERLGQGSVINYGYEGEVLLMVPVRVSAALAPMGRARLAANVEWLVCRDICIPAQASIHLDLPVARRKTTNPATLALFRRTRARVPVPAPRGWQSTTSDKDNRFVLTVVTGRREGSATFFPLVPDQVDNAAQQAVSPMPHGMRLILTKSDLLAKPVRVLKGVLQLGNGRAYRISAPVRPEREMKTGTGG